MALTCITVLVPQRAAFPLFEIKKMATKKAPASKPAVTKKAAVSKAAAPKAVKEVLNKTGLLAYVADQSGVELKSVRLVMAALESAVASSMSKKGAGTFVLPGLLKITAQKIAAKPKRKGLNPFTGAEQWFAAKPASMKIRVRPLKKLKDAAAN